MRMWQGAANHVRGGGGRGREMLLKAGHRHCSLIKKRHCASSAKSCGSESYMGREEILAYAKASAAGNTPIGTSMDRKLVCCHDDAFRMHELYQSPASLQQQSSLQSTLVPIGAHLCSTIPTAAL